MKIFFMLFTSLISFYAHAGLIEISEVDKSIRKDIRYFSTYNFVGEVIDGYKAPKCFVHEKAAKSLSLVQKELLQNGLSLLVYDCYRPQKGVDHFVRWSKSKDQKMRNAFYPTHKKEDLFKLGYISKRSGHTTGLSIDLTVIEKDKKLNSQKDITSACHSKSYFKDGSLDMGTSYDCLHEVSHTDSPLISIEQKKNRYILKNAMEKHGFKNYSKEWWHFTYTKVKKVRFEQDVE